MTPTRHQRCIPCTSALFSRFAPAWEDGPILSSLIASDGIRLQGAVIPHDRSGVVHAVVYEPGRRYLGEFESMAKAKEAVELAVLEVAAA